MPGDDCRREAVGHPITKMTEPRPVKRCTLPRRREMPRFSEDCGKVPHERQRTDLTMRQTCEHYAARNCVYLSSSRIRSGRSARRRGSCISDLA